MEADCPRAVPMASRIPSRQWRHRTLAAQAVSPAPAKLISVSFIIRFLLVGKKSSLVIRVRLELVLGLELL